jgi:hypothetical protein
MCFPLIYFSGLQIHQSLGSVAGCGNGVADDFLLFNLSINSGNSGGPIFVEGKVVAVCCCTLEGMYYAIESSRQIIILTFYFFIFIFRRRSCCVRRPAF